MSGFLRAVATVASVAAIIPGPHQPIAAAVATVAGIGSQLTAKKPRNDRQGTSLSFKIDPGAPLSYVMGRAAIGGTIVHKETYGTDQSYFTYFVDLGAGGPYDAIETFLADRAPVSFSGTSALGYYANWMWQDTQLGQTPEPRALTNGIGRAPYGTAGQVPGWSDAHRMSGHAAASLSMLYDTKARRYANGEPLPGWIVRGAKVYDPRLDSTYPGGSGPCRWADPSDTVAHAAARATWVYSTSPALHGLMWRLGIWQRDETNPAARYQRIMGIGAPIDLIDVAAIVNAANVQEANGWTIGGEVTSAQDKWEVLKLIDQSGGSEPISVGARMSTLVKAPRVPLRVITQADLADGTLSSPAMRARSERINGYRARFRSEPHGWEMTSIDIVQVPLYVTEDGRQKTGSGDFSLVTDPDQCAELAAYEVFDSREIEPISIPLKPFAVAYRLGDCLTLDLPELALEMREAVVRGRSVDPVSGIVTLTFRSETAAKHPACLGQTGDTPPSPTLTAAPDSIAAPAAGAWTLQAGMLATAAVSVPILLITGAVDNSNADAILFEYRLQGAADWIDAGLAPADTIRREIRNVTPAATYEVAVRYRGRGILSERRVIGPVTVGAQTIGGIEVAKVLKSITDAQTLAAGKNTIFYRSTAPSAAESVENDRWVDTTDGRNVEYRRGAGSGVLAVGGSRLIVGGDGVVVAPWLPASDLRLETNRAAIEQAQARLNAILSDGILSIDEKRQFAREWQAAQTSYAALDQKAASFGNVAALRSALTTAYSALAAAIAAIQPPYNDFTVDSPVDRAGVETRWASFYTAFAALDVAITAQTVIIQWSVTGQGGWHADYAVGDKYQRQSVDGGLTFGPAQKAIGEDGRDGRDGLNGSDGAPGAAGADGRTTYLHTAYANAIDGSVDFTTGEPGTRRYLGVLVDFAPADSTNPATYSWSLIKGADGLNGKDGTPGAPGANGQPTYVHIAYANAADGSVDFSVDDPAGRRYVGFYVDQIVADSTNPVLYAWSLVKGDQGPQGIPGAKGADGQTLYTWVAYANAADGSVDFTTGEPSGRRYLGVSPNQPTAVEGTTPAAYTWSLIKGADGQQGIQGPPGADGAPRFIWVAYADSADGTVNFTTGEPGTRTYIGVSPNRLTAVESTTPADYSWAKVQGEKGAAGINGQRTSFVFQRAATQPATPTSTTTPPTGWSDAPPVQTDPPLPLWQSSADFRDVTRLTAWSSPIKLTAASLLDLDPVAAAVLAGKGRQFRQATAPLASVSQENDLWISTGEGDALYVRGAGSGVLAIGGKRLTFGGNGIVAAPWLRVSNPEAVKAAADAAAARAVADAAVADGVLTPDEKRDLATERAAIVGEQANLVARANAQGVNPAAYQAAYTALIGYLDTLALGDRSSNTSINATAHTDRLSAYYTARTALLAAIGDLTAANQVVVTVQTAYTVEADYQGVVTSGLPLTIEPKVRRGALDVRAAGDVAYAITTANLIATVNNIAGDVAKGVITVTALPANIGAIDLVVTVAGVAQPAIRITLSKRRADPPVSGGSTAKSASDSTLTAITSTTFAQISDTMTVGLAAGERLVGTAALDYNTTGGPAVGRTVSAKWQYAVAGSGTWSDFAAAVTGSAASGGGRVGAANGYYVDPTPGHVDANQARAGLTGGTYDVRLIAALDADGQTVSFADAGALIEAKP